MHNNRSRRLLVLFPLVGLVLALALPAGAVHLTGADGGLERSAPARPAAQPQLVRLELDGVPSAVVSELRQATDAWSEAFANQAACLGVTPVRFEVLPGLKGGYVVGEQAVVLNPDRPARTIPLVAVHELSHHVMMACDLNHDEPFRAAFYSAQGLPLTRGWFDYDAGWEASPAEHFAEAVTVLVLGEASGRVEVREATLTLLADWIGEHPA